MIRHEKFTESSWIMTLASIAVVTAALYLAKGVLVPFTLAVLLSFLLSPVCDWLERWKLGRIPAVLMTATLGFSMLGLVFWTAAVQISHLAPKLPEYRQNIEAKFNSVNEYAAAAVRRTTNTAQELGRNLAPVQETPEPLGTKELPYSVRILSSPESPLKVFGGMFGTVLDVVGTTGIVMLLVIFLLLRREDLRDRFILLFGIGHVTLTTQTLEDAAARVSRYLSLLFLLNIGFGISIGVGLSLIGIPNSLLWGILAALLRFIPYLGPWIAAAMPLGLSMAISNGWIATIFTLGLFVLLELLNNNLLEPWLYGERTGVSPVAIVVAAVFWTWLWGPIGLLLATPLTVCVLVVGKHVPELSFLDTLLGTDPVFEPHERIYQRLLAGDQEEATEMFEIFLKNKPLIEVYDTVLIPALVMTETHWRLGELDERKHKFILECLKEIIQDCSEHPFALQVERSTSRLHEKERLPSRVDKLGTARREVYCIPARTEGDEITALLLKQVLETDGSLVHMVTNLASEMDVLFADSYAPVIFVSATRPAAILHARSLCKRLRSRLPEAQLIVGLWGLEGELNKAGERIGCGVTVISTLAGAGQQVSCVYGEKSLTEEAKVMH